MTPEEPFAQRVRPDEIANPWEVHNPQFRSLQGDVRWTVLWEGGRWLEGPAWNPAARVLVFSDIPNNRLLRLDDVTGGVGVFRHPAGFPNGNSFRPPGSPDHLRARRAPCGANRARCIHHRARR